MSKYQLIYFPVRGRAEAMRVMLTDNGIDFEEINCGGDWQTKWKAEMAFGQTPCLKDNELTLVQSNTILRHLARKHGLYGVNAEEAAYVDMIVDGVEDLRNKYAALIYKNYETGKDKYIADLKDQLLPFEKLMEKLGNGKSGFAVGEKKSLADYALFDLLDVHHLLAPACLDQLPALKAFYTAVLNRPGVQAYRETEGFKTRKVNGNDNQ